VLEAALAELLGARAPEVAFVFADGHRAHTGTVSPRRAVPPLAPAMLWKCDARGEFTHFTRRFLEFLGCSEADARGRGWFEAVHADDRGRLARDLGDLCAAPREGDARLPRARGGRELPLACGSRRLPASRRAALSSVSSARSSRSTIWSRRETPRSPRSRGHEAANRELEELALAGAHDLQEPLRSLERELGDSLRGEPVDLALALRQVSRIGPCCATSSTTRVATQIPRQHRGERTSRRRWSGRARETCDPRSRRPAPRSRSRRSRVCLPTRSRSRGCSRTCSRTRCAFRSAAAPVIAVGATPREHDVLVFGATTPSGIPPAHHESVFRVFERANAEGREGSGMASPICRRIVERHGGGSGSSRSPASARTFYFTLPPSV